MLRRQRTILKLLGTAGGSLSSVQLQKFLFLLKQETSLGRDTAFYDFLPYKFGPYSFAANREIDALIAYQYVEASTAGTFKNLTVTSSGKKEAAGVDTDTERAMIVAFSKYGRLAPRDLMKDVYARYPWYAINSEAKDIVPKNVPTTAIASPGIYTMGYEDRSVDGFFEKLLRTGIRRVIDVRSNPVSRKYGFAKGSMSSIAMKLGIEYVHHPELGITSDRRKGMETPKDFEKLFGYYERKTLPAKLDEITAVSELMKEKPSVLVCMEKEAVDCHRSRLAAKIADQTGLKIVHL